MKTSTSGLVLLLVLLNSAAVAGELVAFNRDVRPILSDRCFKCHGPDADNQDSAFRLDARKRAVADLGGYFGIVPGNLKQSELHRRIHTRDKDIQMPPPDSLRRLTEREKEVLDRWILQGAKYDSHWSFQSLPTEIAPPHVEGDWALNNVDRFVAATLKQKSLRPNRPASREKWLRRVTFDLTGLPPTLNEIDAFLRDASGHAYEHVVDRLLDTDACAERLTSEWLDVARYSDSFGYQRDDERFVWPWRDWVIKAFRRNMPYDEFVTLQLAGDLLPNATRDQILATTFNRLHSHKKEGGVALEEFRIENVADRTHTFASAFMGLTLECSRCHDHKYDPITMNDYYRLTSFFANIDERGLISYFTDAVPTPAMPFPSRKQEAELATAGEQVAAAERQLKEVQTNVEAAFDAWLDEWRATGNPARGRATENRNAAGDKPSPKRRVSTESERLPGLVGSLSFEELLPATEDESKSEEGKDVAPEKMRAFANAATDARRAVTPYENRLVDGPRGKAVQLTGDDAVVLRETGHFGRHQPFSVSLWINTPEVTERAVVYRRSRGWDDAGTIGYELTKEGDRLSAKLVHFWPGNAICVETTKPLETNCWYHVAVTYDGSSKAAGLRIFVDGEPADTTLVHDHLTRNITEWRQGYYDLAIGARYRDRGFKGGNVDEFRVYDRELAAAEIAHLHDGVTLDSLRRKSAGELTPHDRAELKSYFLACRHEASRTARNELAEARRRKNAVIDGIPAITIMREQARPRPAYILTRGVYNQRGEQVTAGTPAFLPSFPKNAPRNRLGLAHWLTADDHPLTARVAVNRYWQMLFGTGLVPTSEDFGNQGEPPSHPDLLDWLARDFVDNGWDVRRLLRMMVLSATYRQSGVVSREQRDKDPENRWLSRGPSQRLSAEMIRDNALAVSSLLVRKVGGPPVKPYDVALAYTPLAVDEGQNLYRRSLYTFWKRTSPSPVMMTMNAAKRDVCRLRREVTSSPLQSLVLLNGAQFTEAARVFAAKLLKEHGANIESMILESFRLMSSRQPADKEVKVLRALFDEQVTEYEEHPELMSELAEANGDPPTARLAAATILVNSIMNLDECVRHQ